jgi:drug/metabolite transporter (DMT)-like permease
MAVNNLHPVFAGLLAHVFLSERLKFCQCIAIFGIGVGIAMISRPTAIFGTHSQGTDTNANTVAFFFSETMGYISGVISSLFAGLQYVIFRKARDVNALHFMLWAQILLVALSPFLALLPSQQLSVPSSGLGWAALVAQGMLLTGATFLYVYASKRVAAATASVIGTTEILWGYAVQILTFGEVPSLLTAAGVAVMMVCTVAIVSSGRAPYNHMKHSTVAPGEVGDAQASTRQIIDTEVRMEYTNVAASLGDAEVQEELQPSIRRAGDILISEIALSQTAC